MNSQRSLAARRTRRIRLLQNLSFAVLASGGLVAPRFAFAADDAFDTNPVATGGIANFSNNFTLGTQTPAAGGTGTPASGDALYFGTSSTTTLNDDLAAGTTFAGLFFNSGASAFTIGGNAFALSANIVNNSASAQTINNAITLTQNQAFSNTATGGSLNFGGGVSGAGFTLTTNGGPSGAIAPLNTNFTAGTVTLGTLNAQGNSNAPGNYSIQQFTNFNGTSVLNVGNVSIARSNLVFGGNSVVTISGNVTAPDSWAGLTITGSANVTAANVLMNSSPNSQTGQLVLNGGTLTTGSIGAYDRGNGSTPAYQSALVFNGTQINASVSSTNFISISTTNGGTNEALVAPGGLLLNTGAFNETIGVKLVDLSSAVVSNNLGLNGVTGLTAGPGKVVKSGAGTLTLSGVNTYSGGTTVNQGTLTVGSATGLGATTGPLNVSNTNGTAAGTDTVLNLSTAGGNTVGSLSGTIATPTSGTNTATINAGANLFTVNQTVAGTYAGVIAGTGGFTLGSLSTAALDLTGANNYSGATNVTAGALQIGFGGSLPAASPVTVSGTGSLILGDAGGVGNATFNNLSVASTATVVGGATGQFSTLTLNNAGNATYANVFGGTAANQNNLNVVVAGTGTAPTTILTGLSTYGGFTSVSGGSTLNLAGGSVSGSVVTVSSGGTLTGSGNNSTTGVVGGLVAAGGSTLTLAGTSGTALRSTGAITLGGTGAYGAGGYATLNYTLAGANAVEALNTPVALTLNSGGVFVNVTNPTTTGTYTLANYGSHTGTGTFSLSSTTAGMTSVTVGRNTESLTFGATSLVLTITGAATPNVAFFNGAVSNVLNDTTTSSTLVNFSTNQVGTTDAGNVPGSNTDVVLVANNATNASHRNTANIVTTLGANTTINSLNALSATSSGLASFTINADGSTLTINGNADNNTATGGGFTGNTAGSAIRLATGAAPLTVNAPVVLGTGANLTFTNNSSNALTLGGAVTSAATTGNTQTLTLTNNGTGGTTINGVIANSALGSLALVVNNPGTGVTTLGAANTYTGGTTLNAGTLTATAAGGLGTGNVTVDANDNNFDDAILNTNGSIAATAALLVNSTNGNGTVNFNGTTPTIGSLTGNGNVVLNNPGGTTLTVGNTANNLSSNFSGPISGTGSLVTAGTGTVVLSGTNTYNGSTTVSGGILQLGSAAALPANTLNGGANLVINTGGTLDLNSNSTALAATPTGTGGTITDSSGTTSALTLGGGGTLAQTLTGNLALAVPSGSLVLNTANTYSGGTTITGAGTTLTANNATSLGANSAGSVVNIGNGTSLLLNDANSNTYNYTFSGSGVLKLTTTVAFPSGTTIPNFNNFTGTLEISTVTTTGGKLALTGQAGLSGARLQVDNGAQAAVVGGGIDTFTGISIIGTGNTETRGAIRLNNGTLNGNITLAGSATVGNEGGTLTGNISAGVAGTQTLTMGTANSNGTALLSGNLTDGSGQLALAQAFGTTTLSGTASTYTGGTTVTGGTLLVNGNTSAATGAVAVTGILGGTGSVGGPTTVNAGGRITGGTIGGISTLTLANTLTINGTYLVDIAAGVNQSDRLTLSGTGANGLLTLGMGSTLTLSTTTLDGTSTYALASYTSLNGTFTTTNVPTGYTLVYGGTELDLVPSASVPEPSTLAAAFLGLGALGWSLRRRGRNSPAASRLAI